MDLADFKHLLKSKDKKALIVVSFCADWCGPCKRIAPKINELARQMPHVTFAKVDVDKSPELGEYCAVDQLPTFHFYRDRKLEKNFHGADFQRVIDTISELEDLEDSED